MKKFFPALNKNKNLIFADNAGGSQIPEQVLNNLNNFLINSYAQPTGNSIISKNLLVNLDNINDFVNILYSNKNGNIIYGGSCTQLVYNLSNSMENFLKTNKGEIILPNFSHESCVSPFERIAKKNKLEIFWWNLEVNSENNSDCENDCENNLEKYKINYDTLLEKVNINTSLVVLPHVSNILGNVLDIKYLTNEIKKKNSNTKVLVDGVAYMPHGLIDVTSYNVDFYVSSFYKFCGLRISTLYVKEDSIIYLDNINHYFLNKSENKKLELGGINFECASSILGLKEYLLEFARFFNYEDSKNTNKELKFDRKLVEFIYSKTFYYEKVMLNLFNNFIINNKNIEVLECKDEMQKTPLYSILFKDYDIKNINLILNELGIITNVGTFYCNRLLDYLNIKNGVLRISLMHYNSFDEVNKIIETLNYFKKYNINFQFSFDTKYKGFVTENLKNSFYNLEIDNNYSNKRTRGYSLLDIENIDSIKIIGDLKFYQSSNYNNVNGDILREYKNINSSILEDDCFKYFVNTFLTTINNEFKKNSINDKIKYIQVHQIRVYTESEDEIDLVPEGIHKDGYNFIAMCCVTRRNISGAISHIYDESKTIVHSVQLQEGEMLVLNDHKMFHSVSPIKLNKTSKKVKTGYRDIFVFTTIS
tara:strand:- start:2696 stop:4639 length:1944 start_codon:yes stop_codon:yes gene_type:complete